MSMFPRIIALDTETTGLDVKDGHRVIEIGCVELVNRSITGRNFHTYLNPDRVIDKGAQAVHGITEHFLADKPKFSDVVEEFLAFIKGAQVVIHNAPFDVGFLNVELNICQPAHEVLTQHCEIIDTLALARARHPGQKNNLDALCKRYEIDASHRQLHGALLDAELLARLYLAMTGGQGQLFTAQLNEPTHNHNNLGPTHMRNNRQPLPVIAAVADELSAHDAFLQKIAAQNNGTCLWKELEK